MRRLLLMAAAGAVLVVNGWGVVQAWRNQKIPRGGTLDLTERELRIQPMAGESTVMLLRVNWRLAGAEEEEWRSAPEWLTVQKLTELGFDCTVPLGSPKARRHYTSQASRPVFVAMEFEGDAWRKASPEAQDRTHLFVVDAARDPDRLRERYPDVKHYVICRGLAAVVFRDRDREGKLLATPRLVGWIQMVRPSEIFVPLSQSRMLKGLSRPTFEESTDGPLREPRFTVRVSWGANFEPWVEKVSLLGLDAVDKNQ